MNKKSSSQEDMENMPSFESYRKLKRFRFLEPYVGVLGFFIVIVCVICCFFYLDYRAVVKGYLFPGQTERFVWLHSSVSTEVKRVDFLSNEGDDCDVFDGEWAWDESYPLYKSKDCRFLDEGFRCSENGRPDLFYTKWRWQPRHCNLPRFNAKLMLEKLRNKRLVFVGDSIGRNQWESLLCMISSAVSNRSSIYEVNGNPITKHKGYLVFKFEDFNCTVEYYRAPFLVLQSRPPAGAPQSIRSTLKLDKMDWNSGKWKDADVLVLNTGHWWNYEKTVRGGCYFQEGTEVKMEMEVEHAYQRSIATVMQWMHDKVNPSKTQVFFRTFAPVHFRGGDWKNGGSCNLETLPEMGSSLVPLHAWSQYKLATDVLLAHTNRSVANNLHILNITHMTSKRKDGHSSIYYLGPGFSPASLRRQDCSHWCLPGVPDSWNELLYALYLKHEATKKSNSTNV